MNFYKGNDILDNKVVKNYLEGYYINKQGVKEKLSNKINKFNVEAIKEVKELNIQWYGLLIYEKVIISLIKFNSDYYIGEMGNIFNLIKSQSATIRYNRLFRNKLKEFAIDKKPVYDALQVELKKQRDRIYRNGYVMDDLLKNYHFDEVLELVKSQTGMTMKEHVVKFFEEQEVISDKNLDKDDEAIAFYAEITEKYIDYLRDLCVKHNVSLDNSISEALVINRERKERAKEEHRARVIDEKRTRALNTIMNHVSLIQADMMSSYDDQKNILNYLKSYHLYSRVSNMGGVAWIIGVCRESSVKYVLNSNRLTTDVDKMALFYSRDEANEFIRNIKEQGDEISKYHMISQKLTTLINDEVAVTFNGNEQEANVDDKIMNRRINEIISDLYKTLNYGVLNSNYSFSEHTVRKYKEGMNAVNGYVGYNTDCKVALLVAVNALGNVTLVGESEILGYEYTKTKPKFFNPNDEQGMQRFVNMIKSKHADTRVLKYTIRLHDNWYKSKMCVIKNEELRLNRAIRGDVQDDSIYFLNDSDKSILNSFRSDGNIELCKNIEARYRSVLAKDNMKSLIKSIGENIRNGIVYKDGMAYVVYCTKELGKYYSDKTKNHLTNSLANIRVFDTFERAIEAAKLLDLKYKNDIVKILRLDLNGINLADLDKTGSWDKAKNHVVLNKERAEVARNQRDSWNETRKWCVELGYVTDRR